MEKSADEILNDQIEEELNTFEEDVEVVEEELVLENSMGDMIKKVFNTKSETESLGIAKLLNMTDVKVALAMQKQNPDGFENHLLWVQTIRTEV